MIMHLAARGHKLGHDRKPDVKGDCGIRVDDLPPGDRIMIGVSSKEPLNLSEICPACLELAQSVPEAERAK